MIFDTSGLVTVLNREPEGERFKDTFMPTFPSRLSVANTLDLLIMVVGRSGTEADHEPDEFLEHAER